MYLYKTDKLQYVSEVAAFTDGEDVFNISRFVLSCMSTKWKQAWAESMESYWCLIVEEKETNFMSQFIKFYFTSSMLSMFRTLIHPSSGACDFSIVSPHWLCVLVSMCVGVSVWLGWGGIRVAGWSLSMFRTLIHPSSGACDFSIVSPHWWWHNRKVAGSWWWMY